MKRFLVLIVAALMVFQTGVAFADTSRFEVTEPITIEWWHAHEHQWIPTMEYMVEQFEAQHPHIRVEPVYIGSYAEVNTKFIAAVASGDVPALVSVKTNYLPGYAANGLGEALDPYIEAYNFPAEDFGEGLVNATTFNAQQVALPYLTSARIMLYNKTAAESEGITMPKTLDEMDAFLEKATLFNEDGTTKRYGTVIPGWDYTFYEYLYKNNGVEVVREDGTSDLNEEMSVYITNKIKEWIDKGYAYYAYGTAASSNMRQLFWDGGAFSVIHTSSLYDTYVENCDFEVGISWIPGGMDGENFYTNVSGAYIMIPQTASQRHKNAAWQFMMFMVSPEMSLYWADETGYYPSRKSVADLPEYQDYLSRKPAVAQILEMSDWIMPNPDAPYYEVCANEWRHALAEIFVSGAPVQRTLDNLVDVIEEIIEDY